VRGHEHETWAAAVVTWSRIGQRKGQGSWLDEIKLVGGGTRGRGRDFREGKQLTNRSEVDHGTDINCNLISWLVLVLCSWRKSSCRDSSFYIWFDCFFPVKDARGIKVLGVFWEIKWCSFTNLKPIIKIECPCIAMGLSNFLPRILQDFKISRNYMQSSSFVQLIAPKLTHHCSLDFICENIKDLFHL
jgi:hypothetical protein